MSNIIQFKEMIKDLKSEVLSEICKQFLFDHEGAMRILSKHCNNFGIHIDDSEIKDYKSDMHSKDDFDNVVFFGIELSENQL